MKKTIGGRYIAEERLDGTSVIRATNIKTGEQTAIKAFPLGSDEAKVEADVWKKVYPSEFCECFDEGAFTFVVRKWISGETISDYIAKNGIIAEKRALEIARDLSEELWKVYRETGLVHGDVKPDNVILTDTGVRLIDFESSCPENVLEIRKEKSKRRTLKFITPGFSAPEKMKGITCEKSDFYSVGMIIVYMLTGDTVKNADGISPSARRIIDSCVSFDLDKRIGSIEALVQEAGEAISEAGETQLPKLFERREGLLFESKKFGYRRLILYVPDNVCFSTELASSFQSSGLKTGIFEMCDYGDGIGAFYVRQKKKETENYEVACEKEHVYGGANEVFLATKKLRNGEILSVDAMRDFMISCYSDFDVTIVCDSLRESVENKAQLMRFSDYIVVPACPDNDVFEETVKKYRRMCGDYAIPEKRIMTVAWEYRKGESAEESVLRKISGTSYLGRVETDGLRHKAKNIDGVFYGEIMPENIVRQYKKIVERIISA